MPDLTKAKHCPFCGLAPIVVGGGAETGHSVICRNRKCRVMPLVSGKTRTKAVAAWNVRTVDPELPRLVFIERQLRNVVYNVEQAPEQRTVVQLVAILRSILGLAPGERP